MKKIIYMSLILCFGNLLIFAQTSKPETNNVKTSEVKIIEREKFDPTRIAADDLKSAISKATAENKRIILDVGGEWCGWCRFMDTFLVKNVELGKLRDDNFVWVKINMSEENENKEFLAAYPAIKGYPHLFVLEKDGTLLKSQDTSELEDGKSYNLQKFTEFLQAYQSSETITVK